MHDFQHLSIVKTSDILQRPPSISQSPYLGAAIQMAAETAEAARAEPRGPAAELFDELRRKVALSGKSSASVAIGKLSSISERLRVPGHCVLSRGNIEEPTSLRSDT